MNKKIPMHIVMQRIMQVQTVLSLWQQTLSSDDGNVPDMIDVLSTLLEDLADAIAIDMELRECPEI
ncbi:hypothetical protein [Pantoea cypripedii]|uniref:Uncharacterized protein n=1 Tax=Pantoea cypripedii TaxID=55209 RepID=A0A6B9G659_PANCY|nr:hypothetical protein [Pantoea cypripedii]QGY33221.1 hypothetical protein CUN67_30395 [Pantoea cypripedii]